jgi:DNA-binding XRE family transcriptional regulator
MTQAVLAQAVGVSRPAITSLEQGNQQVTLLTLVQVAQAVGADLMDLVPPLPSVDTVAELENALGEDNAIFVAKLARAVGEKPAPHTNRKQGRTTVPA